MNPISGNTASSIAASQAVNPAPEMAQAKLQAAILKKALEVQKSDAQSLISMMQGKGQIIDIRA